MTSLTQLLPAGGSAAGVDPLRLAAAAYLARFTGLSRTHAESDLRVYLSWCVERGVDPLAAGRAQVELYVRWMREGRRFRPSTVSRRMTVVVGFYRTCVIDGVLAQSPAEYVRRPAVPADSPTLGLTHLQFEALLSSARDSANGMTSRWCACWVCSACGSSKRAARTSPTWARSTAIGC